MPDTVLKGVSVLGHVASEWFCTDGKVNACSLEEDKKGERKEINGLPMDLHIIFIVAN